MTKKILIKEKQNLNLQSTNNRKPGQTCVTISVSLPQYPKVAFDAANIEPLEKVPNVFLQFFENLVRAEVNT